MIDDPYTLLLRSAWMFLRARTDFCALVPLGNQIDYLGDAGDPEKESKGEADFPYVRVIVARSGPGQANDSASISDRMTIQVQVKSGDKRLHRLHNPLRWIVLKAMVGAQVGFPKIMWNGMYPFWRLQVESVEDGQLQNDLERGIIGWSAVWQCSVDMRFDRNRLD